MKKYWFEDMVWEGPREWVQNTVQEFEEDYRRDFIHAFPDKHATDLVRVAEGDWIAGAGHQDTTFANSWLGIPLTGKNSYPLHGFLEGATDESTGERKLAENLVLIDILGSSNKLVMMLKKSLNS